MSCRKLIDDICALGCVGEERSDELDQLLCLKVNEGTFVKEVADICQGGFLQEIPFKQILIYQQKRPTNSSERYENLSHVGTHPTIKEGYIHMGIPEMQRMSTNVLVQDHPRTAPQGHVISDRAHLDGGIRLQ
jgi:hypothetical protein